MYCNKALTTLKALLATTILATALAADPQIVHVGDVSFSLGTTYPAGTTPEGDFVFVDTVSGTFNTTSNYTAPGYPSAPPFSGTVLPGGQDYARLRTDGSIGIHVRIAFLNADPQSPDLFWYESYGYVEPNAFVPGTYTTEYGQYDNYQVIRINTNSTTYGWMNAAILVGQERLTVVDNATTTVELKVFRVVINP